MVRKRTSEYHQNYDYGNALTIKMFTFDWQWTCLLKEIRNLGWSFSFASFPALFAILLAVDHVSLLIADSSWIVRPRVTAAILEYISLRFRYFSRYFTEKAKTCH